MEEKQKWTAPGRRYTYEDFLEIIHILRSKDGCPWDREQTHESLKPCLTEEAAEVLAAIRIFGRTGDSENLVEELGDVLLQVVMHAEIGREEQAFSMEDVVQAVSEKMVRRHPHVFGEVKVDGSGQVLSNWEEIKKGEKVGKAYIESPLKEIPPELPALARAAKLLKKADRYYEKQPDYRIAAGQLREAADKLAALEGCGPEATSGAVGDVLVAVSQISRICGLYQEQILVDRIEDLIERYEGRNTAKQVAPGGK